MKKRKCKYFFCEKILVKKNYENNVQFKERRYCSRSCAALDRQLGKGKTGPPTYFIQRDTVVRETKWLGGSLIKKCEGCGFVYNGRCMIWVDPVVRWRNGECKQKGY